MTVTTRISLGLALFTMTVVFIADGIGLIPDRAGAIAQARGRLARILAIQISSAAASRDIEDVAVLARALVRNHPDILSIGVYDARRRPLVRTDGHATVPTADGRHHAIAGRLTVPWFTSGRPAGRVEIQFRSPASGAVIRALWSPATRLALFIAAVGLLGYRLLLGRTLRMLDPASAIPERVKSVFDTLAEAVLVLDARGRIMLANEAFVELSGTKPAQLQGRRASCLPWAPPPGESHDRPYAWAEALAESRTLKGSSLMLTRPDGDDRMLVVNAAPIRGGGTRPRGALVTFDDVTSVEHKNRELERVVELLQTSRDRIREQNEQLQHLATVDALTGCLNRRGFLEAMDRQWRACERSGRSLALILLDIDHFKAINDTYGHAAGDTVLARVGQLLGAMTRPADVVGRYGGEEFCVLLPETSVSAAQQLAQRIRRGLESEPIIERAVTASMGISATHLGAAQLNALIHEADQALYAAKEAGRNRVVRHDEMPPTAGPKAEPPADVPCDDDLEGPDIPLHAVLALMSALGHRDPATASHSQRVASLCVSTARASMSAADCFMLEVAALLHDIGKIGIPDSVLLKPGPLTDEEWRVMRAHDRLGTEIIDAAFASPELTNIVREHHAWYGGKPGEPGMPRGDDIPVRSRILAIADAYDAMVTDRPYRKGRAPGQAIAELRRWSGRQFDPVLVERFVDALAANPDEVVDHTFTADQDAALRIGLAVERLACAIDAQDLAALSALAGRLSAVARQLELPQVASRAADLAAMDRADADVTKIVKTTRDLIELCRTCQIAPPKSDPRQSNRPSAPAHPRA